MLQSNLKIQFEYLVKLGADKIPHSGKTLLDHLLGTKLILNMWGLPEEVCTAGFFHSVYGTSQLDFSLSKSRDDLAKLIGMKSERLVFEFSRLDRTQFLNQEFQASFARDYKSLAGPLTYIYLSNALELHWGNLNHEKLDDILDLLRINLTTEKKGYLGLVRWREGLK